MRVGDRAESKKDGLDSGYRSLSCVACGGGGGLQQGPGEKGSKMTVGGLWLLRSKERGC